MRRKLLFFVMLLLMVSSASAYWFENWPAYDGKTYVQLTSINVPMNVSNWTAFGGGTCFTSGNREWCPSGNFTCNGTACQLTVYANKTGFFEPIHAVAGGFNNFIKPGYMMQINATICAGPNNETQSDSGAGIGVDIRNSTDPQFNITATFNLLATRTQCPLYVNFSQTFIIPPSDYRNGTAYNGRVDVPALMNTTDLNQTNYSLLYANNGTPVGNMLGTTSGYSNYGGRDYSGVFEDTLDLAPWWHIWFGTQRYAIMTSYTVTIWYNTTSASLGNHYNLTITQPSTQVVASVSNGSSLSVNFTAEKNGSGFITSGLSFMNLTAGGSNTTIKYTTVPLSYDLTTFFNNTLTSSDKIYWNNTRNYTIIEINTSTINNSIVNSIIVEWNNSNITLDTPMLVLRLLPKNGKVNDTSRYSALVSGNNTGCDWSDSYYPTFNSCNFNTSDAAGTAFLNVSPSYGNIKFNSTNYTIILVHKTFGNGAGTFGRWFDNRGTAGEGITVRPDVSNGRQIIIEAAGTSFSSANGMFLPDIWQCTAIVRNASDGSNIGIYQNGTYKANMTVPRIGKSANPFFIGNRAGDFAREGNFTFGGMSYWNQSLEGDAIAKECNYLIQHSSINITNVGDNTSIFNYTAFVSYTNGSTDTSPTRSVSFGAGSYPSTLIKNFGYVGSNIWQVNVTMPNLTGSLKDLLLFISYDTDGVILNDTNLSAVQYDTPYCLVPIENQNISMSVTLCNPGGNTEYKSNISILASNVILDCQGATILGNATPGNVGIFSPFASGNRNVTVQNCRVGNFTTNVYFSGGGENRIINVTAFNSSFANFRIQSTNSSLINSTGLNASHISVYLDTIGNISIIGNRFENFAYGVYATATGHNNITDNYLRKYPQYVGSTADTYGVLLINDGKGHDRIERNNIIDPEWGIRARDEHTKTIIQYNNVTGNNGTRVDAGIAIEIEINNSIIAYNRVINSSWNCISGEGRNNTVDNNYCENYIHEGIDFHSDNGFNVSTSFNITISNNYITHTSTLYERGEYGIVIGEMSDSLIINNTLINLLNSTITPRFGRGILSTSGDSNNNIRIIGNNLSNISGYCLTDNSKNTTWINNYLNQCGDDVRVYGSNDFFTNWTVTTFINNLKLDGNLLFNITTNRTNLTIIQNGSYNVSYNYQSSNVNVFLLNLSSPFDDVRNVSNGVLLATNVQAFNVSLSPNQAVEVGNFFTSSVCQNITVAGTTISLNDNVNASVTCFEVQASNVQILCNDFIISYGQTGGGFSSGIKLSRDVDNVLIDSCRFQNNASSASWAAIDAGLGEHINVTVKDSKFEYLNAIAAFYAKNSTNLNFTNNSVINITITSGGFFSAEGVELFQVSNSSITYNNYTSTGNVFSTFLIMWNDVNSTTVSYNKIITSPVSLASGIFTRYNNHFRNNISRNDIVTVGSGVGLSYVDGDAKGTYLTDNNITTLSNEEGILAVNTIGLNITGNRIISYSGAAIAFQNVTNSSIFNNFINGSITFTGTPLINNWSTNKTARINIIGNNFTGGNFYANSSDNGYSQTCVDSDGDGICAALTLDSLNIDYFPLSLYSNYSVNLGPVLTGLSTIQNTSLPMENIQFNATWTDDIGLSHSWWEHNISGILKNTTITPMTLLANSSGFNWTVNLTEGSLVAFRAFANDTGGNTTGSSTQYFTVGFINNNVSTCTAEVLNLTLPNRIYHLNQSLSTIRNCFEVRADNVTIDGHGYTITYSSFNTLPGVLVPSSAGSVNNLTVKNTNFVTVSSDAAVRYESQRIGLTFFNNTVTLQTSASLPASWLRLNNITSANISGNTFDYASADARPIVGIDSDGSNLFVYNNLFRVGGTQTTQSNEYVIRSLGNDTIIRNNVFQTNASFGIRLYGLRSNVSGNTFYSFAGSDNFNSIISVESGASSAFIKDNNLTSNISSSIVVSAPYAQVLGNRLTYHSATSNGIRASGSFETSIIGNLISSSAFANSGILINGSNNNTVLYNNVTTTLSESRALSVLASVRNLISRNKFETTGSLAPSVEFFGSNQSNLTNNTIISYQSTALKVLSQSTANMFYNNVLNGSNASAQVELTLANVWNWTGSSVTNIIGGSILGGNYYINTSNNGFSQTCIDNNGNGICDAAFMIQTNNADSFPLTQGNQIIQFNATYYDLFFNRAVFLTSAYTVRVTGGVFDSSFNISQSDASGGKINLTAGTYNLTFVGGLHYYNRTAQITINSSNTSYVFQVYGSQINFNASTSVTRTKITAFTFRINNEGSTIGNKTYVITADNVTLYFPGGLTIRANATASGFFDSNTTRYSASGMIPPNRVDTVLGKNQTFNFNMSNTNYTFNAKDSTTGLTLDPVLITATSGDYSTSLLTNLLASQLKNASILLEQGVIYTVTANSSGYAIQTKNLAGNASQQIYTFILSQTNGSLVNVFVYDEDSGRPLNQVTSAIATVTFISNNVYNLTTDNNATLNNIVAGDYEVRYEASGYLPRFYYFSIANSSELNLRLYLLNSSRSTYFTIQAFDESLIVVPNATVKALRYFIEDNSYKIVAMAKTDSEGESALDLVKYTIPYQFFVDLGGRTVFIGEKAILSDPNNLITFNLRLGEDVFKGFRDDQNVTTILYNDNITGNVTFIYSDARNSLTAGQLRVTRYTNQYGQQVICDITSNSSSGTINCAYGNATGKYLAAGFVHTNSTFSTFYEKSISFDVNLSNDTVEVMGYLGAFMAALLIMGITLLVRGSAVVTVMFAILALVVTLMLNMWVLSAMYVGTIIIIGLIILWGNKQ